MTYKNKKSKNPFEKTWIWLLCLIIFPPIAVNVIANTSIPFKWVIISADNQWVGFFSSYLGGIIGGLFTWLGVKATLNEEKRKNGLQEKVELEDRVAIQRYYADKVEGTIRNTILIQQLFLKKQYHELNKIIIPITSIEELLKELAIKVDGKFYVSVLNVLDFSKKLQNKVLEYDFEKPGDYYPHITNNYDDFKALIEDLEELRRNFDVEYVRISKKFYDTFY